MAEFWNCYYGAAGLTMFALMLVGAEKKMREDQI